MRRVLVLEPHPQVLDVLADLVREEPGLELVGATGAVHEAISLAHGLRPDVVLIDVDEPSWRAQLLVQRIGELLPMALLIRMSAAPDPGKECPEFPATAPHAVLKTNTPEILRSLTA